jgi:DNA-binding Lrp family transcriptional regulator
LQVFRQFAMFGCSMTTDSTDRRLIALLREHGRMPVADLSRRIGLSRTTIQSRLERLERQGVIRGYTVLLSDEYERGLIRAHVSLMVAPKSLAAVEAGLRRLHEVRQLYSVSGGVDMIALCEAETVAEMDRVIDRIGMVEGVQRTTSAILLSTRIAR